MATLEDTCMRPATPGDAARIAEQRIRMFADSRSVSPDVEASLRVALPDLLRSMLASGEYVGWLVEDAEGRVIAGAGVHLRRLLPRVETQVAREALVVNVYVVPDRRRQGLARNLMETILAWAAEQGIERVSLHASVMGRSLYETLGFTPTNEMVYYLRAAPGGE
jgi:GNAT superfamily N-acetyltransferase